MTGRALAVTVAVVVWASGAAWGTDINNNIIEDTTWTLAGSPYVIVRTTVEVRLGHTLTIQPGVVVAFEPGRAIAVDTGSSIVALGTAENNIVFTSNSPSPAVGDWAHVQLTGSPGSSFSYCVFEYAVEGLFLSTSSPPVEHCTFQTCSKGLQLDHSSPAITSCDITDCTFAGISCQHRDSVPTIHECNISNPGESIYNVHLSNYTGTPTVTIDATHNWWGTGVLADIRAKIYDNEDDVSIRGLVNYADYLTSPGVEPASWGAIKALFRE
jgi:hypothetical protein